MHDSVDVPAILEALAAPRFTLAEALEQVPRSPGLYAMHANENAWRELKLGSPTDAGPLYVGKAEKSLHSRDVLTHFRAGKTGTSTLRRSIAALLTNSLDLVPCPRSSTSAGAFDRFKLEPGGETRLSEWMEQNLSLSVWVKTGDINLNDLETTVLQKLQPPLNLSKVSTPWTAKVKSRRRDMAVRTGSWEPGA